MSLHRLLLRTAAGALAALAISGTPAVAAGDPRPLQPPRAGPLERAWLVPLRDRVVEDERAQGRTARAARARARAAATTYRTPDGYGIQVEVSHAYENDPARAQAFVDFLASRAHGPEIGELTLVILTPRELEGVCGSGVLACYMPARELMVVPGEETRSGEAPLPFVVTHEYGHHVAHNRRNDPWAAVAWGPKYWATHEEVCRGVQERRYFPGGQGTDYVKNPGENWAEAYALFHYRDAPWQFDPTLRPDDAAFGAIARDVTRPWRPDAARHVHGSFAPTRRRAKHFPVPVALDGSVSLALNGPRRSDFDLRVVVRGRVVERSRGHGSRDRIRGAVCGKPRVEVQVRRARGYGRFALRIASPRVG